MNLMTKIVSSREQPRTTANSREQPQTAANHSDELVIPFVYKRPALQTAANNREQKANKNLH